jgi:branched-chain amino acid transport system ATP-binding protein
MKPRAASIVTDGGVDAETNIDAGTDRADETPGADNTAVVGEGETSAETRSDTADPDALRTEGLTRRFGELVAVDDLSIAIPRGEFRSLIGPNGAGKTTTFDLITGALSPSAGRVFLDGQDVTAFPVADRVHRGLARSFQITTVFGGLSVRENVRLAAQSVLGTELRPHESLFRSTASFEPMTERTTAVLDRVELRERADEPARALAYGDRRRLELAIVLATDPQVVLLDEPTAGMSAEETRATMALIDDVLADCTILLVEHDIDLVMDVSDRITVLHQGRELATGSPEAIARDESVQEAYLGGVRE